MNAGLTQDDWKNFTDTLAKANDQQLDMILSMIADEDARRQAIQDKIMCAQDEAKEMAQTIIDNLRGDKL